MATERQTTPRKPAARTPQNTTTTVEAKQTSTFGEVPPKYKNAAATTEFWLHLIAQVFFALNTSQAWTYMPTKWSATIQGAILIGYMISRSWVKSST